MTAERKQSQKVSLTPVQQLNRNVTAASPWGTEIYGEFGNFPP
jgi:hypothetical protein